jgi:hypothetical protein
MREYNVVTFQEGIEFNVALLERKASSLEGRISVANKQKNAIAVLCQYYMIWTNDALAAGLSCWRKIVTKENTDKYHVASKMIWL